MKIEEIVSQFNNDEIVFINHMIDGETLDSFSLSKMVKALKFQKMLIGDDADDDVKELVFTTYEKVSKLTDAEWEEIKSHSPLPCLDEEIHEEIYEEDFA